MAKVLDLLTDAMQEIGALAIGEVLGADEAKKCLTKLNDMIEAWNTEAMTVYSIVEEVFPVVANKPSYTMGPGGDFDTVRPVRIVDMYSRDSQGNDYPVDSTVNYDTYSAILPKYITSPLAQLCYNDNNFPLITLFPWPIWNDASYSVVIWSWQAISSFSSYTTTISLPPGYNRALKYNLALELGPTFGMPISNDLRDLASSSKAQLKRINTTILQMGIDNFLLKTPVGWNWRAACFGGQ
jgi:hypothetical protein